MPELPDVEIFRQYLNQTSLHKRIQKCRVLDTDILGQVSKSRLQSILKDNQFVESMRHGKYALARLEKSHWLVFHFGMTGFLKYFKKEKSRPEHLRLVMDFSNGYHLGYDAVRKLGQIELAKDPKSFADDKNLGIDALDKNLTFDMFQELISQKRQMGVKSFLMRQDVLCGIGNIYSDEICFQARLNPKKKIAQLGDDDLKTFFESIQSVLETAIDCRANPEKLPDSFIIPQRKKNGHCPGCGGPVQHTKISGRSAYYCASCQQ